MPEQPDLLDLSTYDYELPPELIAQHPLAQRDASRMMHLKRQNCSINHLSFNMLPQLLRSGDLLVLNDSKVIPARLFGKKENGTVIEVLLINEVESDTWMCMVHPGKRLKQEQWLDFSEGLKGFVSQPDEHGLRKISFKSEQDFWDELNKVGHVPLPPYIKRADQSQDHQSYQTVYAETKGSVAAPTAGLHFTEPLLKELENQGISIVKVTLHVGMGTFLPVKTERIDDHKMHAEYCTISEEVAQKVNLAKQQGNRVIAVGSTSARTLESFWQDGQLQSGSKWTDIFIYPGVRMQAVDALITNFHLPKSSLLMMISAFCGIELIKKAYQEAIKERYRFFSYGDAMFIE
ncbi:MAG TPA: tRNA preQ1(34) S-adenosylmethionine ribosyltransferase-isomerase QueA [Candidatus Cloacimonadota bacterium]|nr:tRNA preQ1(34) S-adenosylmethionine ribosyltransferase-isomerase QueA [Candidatus Cloacimonadota bacterium]